MTALQLRNKQQDKRIVETWWMGDGGCQWAIPGLLGVRPSSLPARKGSGTIIRCDARGSKLPAFYKKQLMLQSSNICSMCSKIALLKAFLRRSWVLRC